MARGWAGVGVAFVLGSIAGGGVVGDAVAIVRDLGRAYDDARVRMQTDDRFGSVGWLTVGCSGTPVTPTMVVSAAHCFVDDAGALVDIRNRDFSIDFLDAPDVTIGIASVAVHPSYPRCAAHPCGPGGTKRCMASSCFHADLAVAHLEQPLPSHVHLYPTTSFATDPIGSTVAHVGFGYSGTASDAELEFDPYSYWGFNRIIGRSSWSGALQTRFDASGFNTPCSGKTCFLSSAERFAVREVTTSNGDSGGPVFYNPVRDYEANPPPYEIQIKLIPDRETLIAVTSNGNPDSHGYGVVAGYTYLGDFMGWLESQDSRVEVHSVNQPASPLPNAGQEFSEYAVLPDELANCSDGTDSDGDGLVDLDDPGCFGPFDRWEGAGDLPCDDGIDNDYDGLVDTDDPACGAPDSPGETSACSDGIDNDGDGGVDWDGGGAGTPDPDCLGVSWFDSESPPPSCGLGAEVALLLPVILRLRRCRGWAAR